MENDHLKLFITEELFLLPDDRNNPTDPAEKMVSADPAPAIPEESTPAPEAVVKHPMIVISEALSPEEKELMNKILMAVNVKPNQVHHIEGEPQSSLSYDKLIVFGDYLVEGVDKEYYNITRTTQMSLRARPLSEVMGNREEKTRLWNSLKTWFGL